MGVGDNASSVMEREAPKATDLFWARRSFDYGVPGQTQRHYDRGQVMRLEGLVNDKLLVDLGYVALLDPKASRYPCRVCGAEFVEQRMRDGHGKDTHDEKVFVPPRPPERQPGETADGYQNRLDAWAQDAGRMSDSALGRKTELEEQIAPLHMDKTQASRS